MIVPTSGLTITQDTVLDPGVYFLPGGIIIGADGVTLDGNGAMLVGDRRIGRGVTVEGRSNVIIKNLRIREYYHGIYARGCPGLTVTGCQITSTAEVEANTVFLDIWLPLDRAYGGGILLAETEGARIIENDLQHQMAGILSYNCRQLEVRLNNASYCSGWGFHLHETCDSLYEANCADYCCRWEPRGERWGHMGSDAAGFLIVHSSSRNVFRRNLARLGGDGFFLGGLTPDHLEAPCNNNRFEENDGSYSPNIAFEATFSSGNVYVNNYANFCNYGFWLGFSSNGILEDNQINNNRQAGIATEMGFNFVVRRNQFNDNNYGILLWSKHIPELKDVVIQNDNSYNWLIQENTFVHNNKAVRIAANQDHGIRSYRVPEGQNPATFCRPHDHVLQGNVFRDNRTAVEERYTDRTETSENTFEGNIEGDIITD